VSHRIEAVLLLFSRTACAACTVAELASCARLAAIAGLPLLHSVRCWWREHRGRLRHGKEGRGAVL
jgi:hypothetical protein